MEECNYKAPPSPPPEPFEFPSSSSASSPMICIAGDIISGGKLLPFCAPAAPARIGKAQGVVADSLQLVLGSKVGGAGGYRKLRKEDPNPVGGGRPRRRRKARRWYVLAFGFPSVMELKDIRNRIFRQQNKSPAAAMDQEAAEVKTTKKKEEDWGPWKLLRSFSCM